MARGKPTKKENPGSAELIGPKRAAHGKNKPSSQAAPSEESAPLNLRALAKIAGVSLSTVSRALRNGRYVSRDTCERVQKLATELGYIPNPMVASLMAGRVRFRKYSDRPTIAYLNPFYEREEWRTFTTLLDYFEGAEKRALQYGYKLEEFWLRAPRMTAKKMSDILYNRGIQGLLLGPLRRKTGHLSLQWERFSTAALGYSMTHPAVHRATPDQLTGIRIALRQLRKLGYRRIGLVLDPWQDTRSNKSWSAGFGEYLLSVPTRDGARLFYDTEYNAAKFENWIRKEQPDALMAGATNVEQWMQKLGFSAPRDYGFAVLDRGLHDDAHSGIHQNGTDVGAAAIDLIVGQINRNERGLPEVPRRTIINCRWLDGASTRSLNERASGRVLEF